MFWVLLYMYIFYYIRGGDNYCYHENQSCSQVHTIFLFVELVLGCLRFYIVLCNLSCSVGVFWQSAKGFNMLAVQFFFDRR